MLAIIELILLHLIAIDQYVVTILHKLGQFK